MRARQIFFAAARPFAVCLAVSLTAFAPISRAQDKRTDGVPAATAPYDAQLSRLAEIVGSVSYIRMLCKNDQAGHWRQSMQQLIDTETSAEPHRRARLTAAFNRGYRAFASVYTTCTPSAVTADQRYRAEGATLASEIATRFGN